MEIDIHCIYDLHGYAVCKLKMPDSLFFVQEEVPVLNELRKSSALPSFSTDLAMHKEDSHSNRILIPLTDPEVNVHFYGHVKASNTERLKQLICAIENI